jgi:4-hydroxythreonine-4-phosphate dehydrogenase
VRIAITLGDPTGIGPEIVCAALSDGKKDFSDPIVFGDRSALEAAAALLKVAPPRSIEEVTRLSGCVPGKPTAESGRAQLAYLEAAVAEAAAGRLDAIVTAPIHKASCIAAGFAFAGHTELLQARLAGGAPVTMMFAGPRMRVSLATIHVPLARVAASLTTQSLTTTIVQTAEALARDFGVAAPRVAVAGLNPHAGESGHFGDEETRLVAPAVAEAQARVPDAKITGPHVPDAVFRAHADGRFDAVVALYHDQGLIPVKLIDFEEAVNVTLGLPVVRTSPDHGVAHDIAGTGRARATSMTCALTLATKLVRSRTST